MTKPRLRTPREAAKILSVSFATVKQWIYAGKVRTVRTLGGHHRVLEEDIEKHLCSKLAAENREKWGLGPDKISESNQLIGRILEIKVDGLMAQVAIMVGDQELTSLITGDAAAELGLSTGNNVIALLKSSQIMILETAINSATF